MKNKAARRLLNSKMDKAGHNECPSCPRPSPPEPQRKLGKEYQVRAICGCGQALSASRKDDFDIHPELIIKPCPNCCKPIIKAFNGPDRFGLQSEE